MNSLTSLDLSNHIAPINLEPSAAAIILPPLIKNIVVPLKGLNQEVHDREEPAFGANEMRRTLSHIFTSLNEEEAKKTVSSIVIEQNLISDSNRRKNFNQKYCKNDNKYDESYWDIPSNCCKPKEEKSPSMSQAEKLQVEGTLYCYVEEVKQQKCVVENNHSNNTNWDWPSKPVLESEKRENIIASIMHKEYIRQQLSIDSITSLKIANKCDSSDSQIELTSLARVPVDHLGWSDEKKVVKEEIVAPHAYDASHPNHAYWDFPSDSKDPQVLKKKLTNTILKEESIRNLFRAETVEEREVKYHLSRQGHGKIEYVCAPAHVLESMPSNYWNFNHRDPNNLLYLLLEE